MKYTTKLHVNAWDSSLRRSEYRMCVRDDSFADVDLYFNDAFLGTYWCYSDALNAAEEHAAAMKLSFDMPQGIDEHS